MAQNVISEFVVSLGFKTDGKSFNALNNFLARSAAGVKGFAKQAGDGLDKIQRGVSQLAIVTTAALYTLSRFSDKLESLYFASQRTGTSGSGLQALELIFQNIGVAAGVASGSVERLASELKYAPAGTQGLLNLLGIQAKDASGKLRDVSQIYFDILDKIGAKKSTYEQDAYLTLFGISRTELTQYQNNPGQRAKFDEQQRLLERQHKLFGISAEEGNKFSSAVRTLQTTLENLFYGVLSKLTGGEGLQKLNEWLTTNGATIINQVVEALKIMMEFITTVVLPILSEMIKTFKWLDENTNGWSTKLFTLLFVLNAIGAVSVVSGIASLAAAFAGVVVAAVGAKAAVVGAIAALAVGAGIYMFNRKSKEEEKSQTGGFKQGSIEHQNSLVQKFMDGGLTKNQAIAMVANWKRESSLRPNAISEDDGAHGYAQLRGIRRERFKNQYGVEASKGTDDEQVAFTLQELKTTHKHVMAMLKKTDSLADTTKIYSDHYEIPSLTRKGLDKESAIRQDFAKGINNTFVVTVNTNNPDGFFEYLKGLSQDSSRTQNPAK